MHLFGLTGGIASGKSTVAARLRKRGVSVVDADALAREIVTPGSEGLRAVVTAFGPGVLAPDGSLDRKALGDIVFADLVARRRLEAITHPLIGQLAMERAADHGRAGEPLVCYEAALLVENGMADAFRPLVVVSCPPEVQLARVRARDGSSVEDTRRRMASQKPLAEKVAAADHVIDTSGTLEENARRTDEVLAAICTKLGIDPGRYGLTEGSPPKRADGPKGTPE